MFNFFGKKKLVVNAYTDKSYVYELYKPKYAKDYLPKWFKNTSTTIKNPVTNVVSPTIRGCYGIRNLYSQGVIIPMWSDVVINVQKSSNFLPPNVPSVSAILVDGSVRTNSHSPEQWSSFINPESFAHLKIESPWLFVCDEEVDWIYTGCTWDQEDPLAMEVLTGCLEFKYQHQTNTNIIFRRDSNNTSYTIEAGKPIVHLIPITDREIVLKLHLVDSITYNSITSINRQTTFTNDYLKSKKIRKDNEKSKCPFHF